MKKFLMAILILAMTICGVVGIAACGKDDVDDSKNQGQVEDKDKNDKDKDKDNDTQKPDTGNQNQGSGSETTPGDTGDEGNKGESTNPPKNPEEQEPGKQDPPTTPDKPQEEPKEDEDKKDEEDKGNENEPTTPDPDLPQGDEPGKDEPTTPDNPSNPDNPTTPDTPKPDEPKDEPKECEHNWIFTAVGEDKNNRQHSAKCSICGATQNPARCTFGNSTFVSPTCTEDGYDKYVCSVCGIEFKAYGYDRNSKNGHKYPMTGHTLTANWVQEEGTNKHKKTCTKCDYVEEEECKFDGKYVAPTCENPGSSERTCTGCGRKEPTNSDDLKALGHEWGDYTQNNGETHTKHCIRDCCKGKNVTQTEECHFEVTGQTSSSCTSSGVTEETCRECRRERTTTSSSKGHQLGQGNTTKEPSCTEPGEVTYTCTVCGTQITEQIPANGHKLDRENGFQRDYKGHKGRCTVCNTQVGENSKDGEAHQYGSNNFCVSCGIDGLYANYCYDPGWAKGYAAFVGGTFTKNKKTIVLQQFPYSDGGSDILVLGEIRSGSFGGCGDLEVLYIPKTVTEIASNVFSGCNNLKTIYFGGTQEAWNEFTNLGLGTNVEVKCNKEYDRDKNEFKDITNKSGTINMTEPAMLVDKRSY